MLRVREVRRDVTGDDRADVRHLLELGDAGRHQMLETAERDAMVYDPGQGYSITVGTVHYPDPYDWDGADDVSAEGVA